MKSVTFVVALSLAGLVLPTAIATAASEPLAQDVLDTDGVAYGVDAWPKARFGKPPALAAST